MPLIVPSHPHLRLGRLPKAMKPSLHLSDFRAMLPAPIKAGLEAPPVTFDYKTGLPDNLGVMANNVLGCCVEAMCYHGYQGRRFTVTKQIVSGDVLAPYVVQFYSIATGFNPQAPLNANGQNPTDQGSNMDATADCTKTTGLPMPDGSFDKAIATFSVDPQNVADMAFCGQQSLGLGLGVTLTEAIMPPDGSPPSPIWDYVPGSPEVGQHGIYAFARDANGNYWVCSWGTWYQLTANFVRYLVDTVIAFVMPDAFLNGKTVLGLDAQTWQNADASVATSV